ncbi:MAG TPA: helix-hairpin-helix domain-containing protein [Saprospiraceae bacterium]|nr:helix-hairpin-helix domain-containing protein [Saprospiraceae bacterium]
MIVLFSFCDIPWWLTWLLPFLLGLGLGYLLWSRFKDMVASLEAKINELNMKIGGLEADLETCRKNRIEAEGNVSMLRGRLRELELEAAKASSTTHVGIAATTDHETKQSSESVSFAAAGSDDKWFATIGQDKLQIIEGIGPKMEEVLHENGVKHFSALAGMNGESLRNILSKYGDKYRIIDPNTWPQQASLADQRKWNDLIALQKTLDTGRSDTATNGETDSKLEKWLIKAGVLRRWAQDDLKAVEGIGPKIEELMHAAGIKTWRALSETSVSRIQEILTAAGPRFALADPGTWPEQSGMAADGKWDELQKYQDFLNAGKVKKS